MVGKNVNTDILESTKTIAKHSKDSDAIFIKALKSLLELSKRRIISLIIISVLFSPICVVIGVSKDTILLMLKNVDYVTSIDVPVFAVLVSGYAIFQALFSGKVVLSLLSYKVDNNQSYFQAFNFYFLGISSLFLLSIIVNFLLSFLLRNINPDFSLGLPYGLDGLFASIFVLFYFIFHFNLLLEVKCFLINLFQCFNIVALSSVKDELKEGKHEKI